MREIEDIVNSSRPYDTHARVMGKALLWPDHKMAIEALAILLLHENAYRRTAEANCATLAALVRAMEEQGKKQSGEMDDPAKWLEQAS
jgi:hypothetical protein